MLLKCKFSNTQTVYIRTIYYSWFVFAYITCTYCMHTCKNTCVRVSLFLYFPTRTCISVIQVLHTSDFGLNIFFPSLSLKNTYKYMIQIFTQINLTELLELILQLIYKETSISEELCFTTNHGYS